MPEGPKRIAITGSTGLIGTALRRSLEADGHQILAVVRRTVRAGEPAVQWDPDAGTIDATALEGVDAVVHLAGAGIGDERWTDERKRLILESRTKGTALLASTLIALDAKPAVLVSGSAIGYYGDRGDELLDEASPAGRGFLADVCRAWEAEALEAEKFGVRVVLARFGLVLAARGGALERMRTPFRLGLGGKLGSGLQWMSWVHLEDAVGLLLHAAARKQLRGPINVVSPNPVTNQDFTRQLARALARPAVLPVPRLALSLAFGEMSEVLLESQRVLPRVAQQSGYAFAFPDLAPALLACTGQARAAG